MPVNELTAVKIKKGPLAINGVGDTRVYLTGQMVPSKLYSGVTVDKH